MKLSTEAKARGLLLIALAAAGCAALVGYFGLPGDQTIYEIRTRDPVSGLTAGAPVEFHGVEVGRVTDVALIDPHRVAVRLSVRRGAPISRATVATITGRGLAARGYTGYVYVALEDDGAAAGPAVAEWGARYPSIRTARPVAANLDTTMAQLNESVRSVTTLLQMALDDGTLGALKQSARDLNRFSGLLARSDRPLAAILANAERASGRINPLLDSAGQALDTTRSQVLPQTAQAAADLARLSADLERTSEKMGPVLEAGGDSLDTLRGQVLPEAYHAAADLDRLARSLDDFTERLNRDPSLLVRGRPAPRPGPGEAN